MSRGSEDRQLRHWLVALRRRPVVAEQAPEHGVQLVIAERLHAAGEPRNEDSEAKIGTGWRILARLLGAANDRVAEGLDRDHWSTLRCAFCQMARPSLTPA